MVKKVILIICFCLALGYLAVALFLFNRQPAGILCEKIELTIEGDTSTNYITHKGVENLLKKKKLYPVGKPLDEISSAAIEQVLQEHPLVADVECYKTSAHNIHIDVFQRVPILRVMNNRGENFYVDKKGSVITSRIKCVDSLPVVTGFVEKSFASRDLYQFGLFLQDNPFWDAQIEQINVLPDKMVELVPRVGNHIIHLGSLDHFEQKLERLKKFYEKGLNEVGWNKYSRINIEFENQIICTKH